MEFTAPLVLGIGAQRSGTTAISHYLAQTRNFSAPRNVKEIHFFDRNYSRGIEWYRKMWSKTGILNSSRYHLDFTPEYMFSPLARHRLLSTQMRPKIVICLRNPIERSVSEFKRAVRNQGIKSNFETYLQDEPSAIFRSCYYDQVAPFVERYGTDVLILVQEADFEKTVLDKKLTDFFSLRAGIFAGIELERKNVGNKKRMHAVYTSGVKLKKSLQRAGFFAVADTMDKLSPKGLFRTDQTVDAVRSQELNAFLRGEFRANVERLSLLIDRDVSGLWKI